MSYPLQYLHRLGALHHRASRGEPYALEQVHRIGALAQAGHPRAAHAMSTLSRIHRIRKGRAQGQAAEGLYRRLRQGDPLARAQLRRVIQGASTGSLAATSVFGLLQAAHRKHKASAWSGPGAPRTGHYPMPMQHRPGIFIGTTVERRAEPLTEFALTRLLALIAQARASLPGMQFQDFGAPPDPTPPPAPKPAGSLSNPYGSSIYAAPPISPDIKVVSRTSAMTSLASAPKVTVRRFI